MTRKLLVRAIRERRMVAFEYAGRHRVFEIAGLRLLDRRFGSRPGESGRHASWDRIEAFVA